MLGPGAGSGVAAARSLYLHVPFCFHKCHYCDFYSFVDAQDRQPVFTDRLIAELASLAPHAAGARAREGGLRTIFVGGGTPSLLRPELWARLLEAMHRSFAFDDACEFTVECNPETVTPELMRLFRAGGVNRVSVGAQSFDQRHLKALERWHDPANVRRALELAGEAGIRRRNIDLIYAVPGQTLESWHADLDVALSLARDGLVDHVSAYALTYEPNTAMTQRLARGEFASAPEELESRMFMDTIDRLAEAGLAQYEISNFARPGSECRHNLAYWRQDWWLAAGPSASAHVPVRSAGDAALRGVRWKNVPRLSDWMQGVEQSGGYSPVVDFEGPDARRALAERIMTGLRLNEGLPLAEVLLAADHIGARAALERGVAQAQRVGHVRVDHRDNQDRLILTREGLLLADGIAADLMACVDDPAARA